MRYFNYGAAAEEAGIRGEELAEIEAMVRTEFPHDDMLFELHVLRACTAVRDGRYTTAELLRAAEPAHP